MPTLKPKKSPVPWLALAAALFLLALIAVAAFSTRKPQAEASEGMVSAATMGANWPFTFSEGRLRCEPPGAVVIQDTASGKTYSLNGTADVRAAEEGWQDARSVWKDAPDPSSGPKVSIAEVTAQGLALCN
ncbi:hypothetical protein GCM10008955_01270 [Deinococcus malanensis]|uniref:DUF2511 domain-containing protein n=1 Tax=Deinococcus malanensis TaxID=1706855 RepID=A0ABQ2EHG5_9DEIO|nr:DUF2511 domain-containing protein [Deinococcus malanensis]GGK11785.1 hypothetical protein GCM10008955_01270 [Deinococcus malanensis]